MRLFALLFICLLSICSCKRDVVYSTSAPVYRIGDNPTWAGKNIDTSGWSRQRKVTGNRIYWARLEITILRRLDPEGALGIKVNAFGGYEFYWDGVRIGRNGRPASAQVKEVPGSETKSFLLPDSLAGKGRHVAAFRLSQAYHSNDLRDIEIGLQNYAPMLRDPLIITAIMHLMAGIFLVASLYYFLLYLNSKYPDRSTLVFGVTCFLFFTLLILEYLEEYIAIPYKLYFVRLYAIRY